MTVAISAQSSGSRLGAAGPRLPLLRERCRFDSIQVFPRSAASDHEGLKSSGRGQHLPMPRSRHRARQHELAYRTWGGARRGAGRKLAGSCPGVSHRARPALSPRHPVHVTIRLRKGLPSLRRHAARDEVERAFSSGAERFGFRLTHYSIQSNHLHVVAEASDRRALSRGMQGLLVRVARRLNRLWGGKGPVFSDRHHVRQLRTPREVRAALVYVLQNARRHGLPVIGADEWSSGPWFDGWKRERGAARPFPGTRARTWLLREGWKRHGLIGVEECPRPGPH